MRQLPNGNVLVASGTVIRELTPEGATVHEWPFAGVTHIALTVDGYAFYAAGVDGGKTNFRFYQFGAAKAIPIGNPEMRSLFTPVEVVELAVVGEWRAGSVFARPRAVRH